MTESTVNKKGKTIYGNPLLNDIHRIEWVIPEEVIVVKCLKGEGTNEDPIRTFCHYWTRNGKFIGEIEV